MGRGRELSREIIVYYVFGEFYVPRTHSYVLSMQRMRLNGTARNAHSKMLQSDNFGVRTC